MVRIVWFMILTCIFGLSLAQVCIAQCPLNFIPRGSYTTGDTPNALASGDFNRDGFSDLAVASSFSGTLSILISNGNGTFRQAVNYSLSPGNGFIDQDVVIADFNRDGALDLAVAAGNSGTVVIFIGNGNGTFRAGVAYAVAGLATGIATGDFNSDGRIDLVFADNGVGSVRILLGNGDGTFQPLNHILMPSTLSPFRIAAADLDRDGRPDLVTTNISGLSTNTISVLLANGNATFQAPITYTVGSRPVDVKTVDLNGDNRLDLLVARGGSLARLLGNGNGTFQSPVYYTIPGGSSARSIALADFGCAARTDVATQGGSSNLVSVLLSNGDGTLQAPLSFSGVQGPSQVVAADFNGDRRPDLAAINFNNGVTVLIGASYTAGAPIQFADPNPYADPDPQHLAATNPLETYPGPRTPESILDWSPAKMVAARATDGAATDGVTRVVIRWPVPGDGAVNFSIGDEANLPQAVGALGVPGQAPNSTNLSNVRPVLVGNQWYAFASYVTPIDFDRASSDATKITRPVVVTARYTGLGGTPILQTIQSLPLIRPPVLFLHGLGGDGIDSWNLTIQSDQRFITYSEDYKDTNESAFNINVVHARKGAQHVLRNAYHRNFSATKVTVIGHSMGGILARLHAANSQYEYYRADNLGQGDFYKMITLYTPHLGSAWACLLDGWRNWWQSVSSNPPFCITCGAVRDLRPDSAEIQFLPATNVPVHVIAGIGGASVPTDLGAGLPRQSLRDRLGKAAFRVLTLAPALSTVLGSTRHDLIVNETSAYGGLTGPATQSIAFQFQNGNDQYIGIHPGAGSQDYIGNQVLEPLIRASVQSNLFAPGLPANSNVPVPGVCGATPIPPPSAAANGGLQINVDPASLNVSAGGVVRVQVNTTGNFQPNGGLFLASSFGVTQIVNATPAIVDIPVPLNALGSYQIHAIGIDSGRNAAFSTSSTVQVSSTATLLALETLNSWLGLGCIGEQVQLGVVGHFTNSVTRDLSTGNTGTTYTSSNSNVASVDANGIVRAVGNGQARITINNGSVMTVADVTVAAAWCTSGDVPPSPIVGTVVNQIP